MPAIRRPEPKRNIGSELVADVRLALGQEPDLVLWRASNISAEVWEPNSATTRLLSAGLGNGCADLVGILRFPVPTSVMWIGRFFALECKAGSGRLSPAQKQWLKLVQRFGAFACVVRSVDDAKAALSRARMGLSS